MIRRRTLMAGAGAGSWWLFSTTKSELAPLEDRGVILATVNAPDGATLAYTQRYMQEIERIGMSYAEFDRVFVVTGNPTVSQGISFLRTTDWDERTRTTQQLARDLQPKFAQLPGVSAFPVTPPSLGGSFRERPVNFVIVTSDSYENLAAYNVSFLAVPNLLVTRPFKPTGPYGRRVADLQRCLVEHLEELQEGNYYRGWREIKDVSATHGVAPFPASPTRKTSGR